MAATLWNYVRIPLFATSGLVAILSVALYYFQNEIIYPRWMPPDARTAVPKPNTFDIHDFEDLMLPTPDGETLNAFFIRSSNRLYSKNITMLMLHGNAGNIGHRVPIAKVLSHDLGCNVLMLEYRGYGRSTGTPNEKGLAIDVQTGLDYVRQRTDLRGTKIVIYGQSLGGAAGIDLVAKNQDQEDIAALILENTFLSIQKMIPVAVPYARFLAPFCHQIWPSEKSITKITQMPVLFLSGLKDEIVPPVHMRQLYSLCGAHIKIWRELPHGDHNFTVGEAGYFQYVDDFLRTYVVKK